MLKRLFYATIAIFSLLLPSNAIAAEKGLSYEIEGAGTATQGSYLVKVTVISKKSSVNNEYIARCAVHGVLFRGFSNQETRQTQKPLAGSPMAEAQHAQFFSEFFKENGPSVAYVTTIDSGLQVVRVNKEYRISTIVVVNKSQLQKDLEKAGVIKGLNSGF